MTPGPVLPIEQAQPDTAGFADTGSSQLSHRCIKIILNADRQSCYSNWDTALLSAGTRGAGYGRLGMAIVRFVHQTAESKGLTWLSHPKHHTATSPSLSLLPLLYCHSCTETMLWVSGTKPCPICKIVTPKQRGGGSTDKTHSSI